MGAIAYSSLNGHAIASKERLSTNHQTTGGSTIARLMATALQGALPSDAKLLKLSIASAESRKHPEVFGVGSVGSIQHFKPPDI